MPTHPKLVYRILNLLNPEPGRYDFVDFGSGKGRVLLIASQFPFCQVIGVEFDRRLHAIAQENIRLFDGPRQCHRDIRTVLPRSILPHLEDADGC
jgi:tRNA1(Val) A37 N6-methylase TrmN6